MVTEIAWQSKGSLIDCQTAVGPASGHPGQELALLQSRESLTMPFESAELTWRCLCGAMKESCQHLPDVLCNTVDSNADVAGGRTCTETHCGDKTVPDQVLTSAEVVHDPIVLLCSALALQDTSLRRLQIVLPGIMTCGGDE